MPDDNLLSRRSFIQIMAAGATTVGLPGAAMGSETKQKMGDRSMNTVIIPQKRIPVAYEVDVLVVGGGPAGIGAAAASAREGLSTVLIEQYGFLGGMWTAGLVNPIFDYKRKGGILREVIDNLKSMDSWSDKHRSRHTFDPETMKFLADKMMKEADVQLLFHSFSTDPIVEDGSIKGVILANKSGSSAILAKVVIDCTGDGDVAARAGAPYEKGRPEDGLMQPMTMMFRIANADPKQNDIPFSEFRDLVDPVNEKEELKLPHHPFKYIHLPINGDVISNIRTFTAWMGQMPRI